MAIGHGTRLGVYEVTGRLGAGGMGEVYRARDTKLHRDVALKVLHDAFARDPERLARFEREAQVLASLNHPHIAAIYGLEEAGDTRAIVMELVEGPTLAERIARGPIPADEALAIARQIADALAAAHGQGIIHRDLKPANITVRDDGTVKVLDFGLAKALDAAPPSDAVAMANSPTITSPAMTMRGVILGTAAYMSPEQAKGKVVDRRADIWAFGCVLFEMLSGRRAFEGEDASDTIVAVLTKEPDWSALPPATSEASRGLLRRCLERDLKRRVPDMSVAQWMMDASPPAPGRDAGSRSSGTRNAFLAAAAVGAVALVASLGLVRWSARPAAGDASYRFTIDLGTDATLLPVVNVGGQQRGVGTSAVLSPDGRALAFVARAGDGDSHLYVRRLDQLSATLLAGTEGAGGPFFSPDGQSIGFFADSKLKRIPVSGGLVATVCEVPAGRGGSWGDDDVIVFTPSPQSGASLMRVIATGGTPQRLTALEHGEATHRWPQVLPGNAGVLFTVSPSNTGPFDEADLAVVPLSGGPSKVVVKGGAHGRYVASGHLLYVNAATLFAVPFDLERLAVTGPPVPAVEGVSYAPDTGGAQFSVSTSGTLLFVPSAYDRTGTAIDWMDRAGTVIPLRAVSSVWGRPAFSPDGHRLALDIGSEAERHVWVYEWERDAMTRLTFGGIDNVGAVWAPDGRTLAFRSNRGPNRVRQVYWQRADGSGQAVALTSGDVPREPFSWHSSGRFLAIQETTFDSNADIAVLSIEGDSASGWKPGALDAFVKTTANEMWPRFSPDGRWLAYESDESGRAEIYVRPFPGPGGKWQISTAGGTRVQWSPRRQEMVYRAPDGQRLRVVPFTTAGEEFRAGKSVEWSERAVTPVTMGYALHPDGDRVAIESPRAAVEARQSMTIVTNFFKELRRLAPTEK